jgi:Arc/MetJ-type ribon-helix-helix transcriptional regulator
MADDAEEMVAFRLGPKDRAAIAKLVETGEFRNRSDFLRYAVKAALREQDLRARAPLDLDLEGIDLPEHAPARAPRSAPRARKGVNL